MNILKENLIFYSQQILNYHYHHLTSMQLGHLLTRSGLTHPAVHNGLLWFLLPSGLQFFSILVYPLPDMLQPIVLYQAAVLLLDLPCSGLLVTHSVASLTRIRMDLKLLRQIKAHSTENHDFFQVLNFCQEAAIVFACATGGGGSRGGGGGG